MFSIDMKVQQPANINKDRHYKYKAMIDDAREPRQVVNSAFEQMIIEEHHKRLDKKEEYNNDNTFT